MQSLKDQLDARTQQHARDAALLRILVEGSEQAATQLLAKMRKDHSIGIAFYSLRRGSDPLPQLYSSSGLPSYYSYSASDNKSSPSSVISSQSQRYDLIAPLPVLASPDMGMHMSMSQPVLATTDYSQLIDGLERGSSVQQMQGRLV
ncbi:hypothetical protein B0A48_18844 [Cryoendolithus antarcticus]|uniref:Uncharacterized protein n=1 Tax=Cryoendolithus antarcticus TaxID=1507870 RepID=A0A1V8S895_9PEZI|nr:hypothetical protein B0A48_18844 [Cryoendolithus antarcticus]